MNDARVGGPFKPRLHNRGNEFRIPTGEPHCPHRAISNRRVGERHEVRRGEIPAIRPAPGEKSKRSTQQAAGHQYSQPGHHISAGTTMPNPMLRRPDQMTSVHIAALNASVNAKYRYVAFLAQCRMIFLRFVRWVVLPQDLSQCGELLSPGTTR